nr:response regulator [Desulfobacula sp.]
MPPGSYVCLRISDTGSGMDEDTRKRIFDPYFTTKVRGKGTGLGLAVVHGIVKKLKGEIVVKSEKGKGTEFSIYLPGPAPGPGDLPPNPRGFSPTPRTEAVLVVDDEESVLKMMDQVLTRTGCRVTCQSSSPKALELFQRDPAAFDLVITDMTMPDLTGDKLISRMKKIRPDIPVILCTGYNEKLFNKKAGDMNADKILMKPVMKDELTSALGLLLDRG